MATPAKIEQNAIFDALRSTQCFRSLDVSTIERLSEIAEYRSYATGQTVYAIGQYDGSEFVLVAEGVLRVSVADAGTGAMMIEDVRARDVFGLAFALNDNESDRRFGLSMVADGPLELYCFDADIFADLLAQDSALACAVARYLAAGLAGHLLRPSIQEVAPEQRVYSALTEYITSGGAGGGWRIEQMPKHRDLAAKAGVAEAVAAGAIATLISVGVAARDYPGLEILDKQRFDLMLSS